MFANEKYLHDDEELLNFILDDSDYSDCNLDSVYDRIGKELERTSPTIYNHLNAVHGSQIETIDEQQILEAVIDSVRVTVLKVSRDDCENIRNYEISLPASSLQDAINTGCQISPTGIDTSLLRPSELIEFEHDARFEGCSNMNTYEDINKLSLLTYAAEHADSDLLRDSYSLGTILALEILDLEHKIEDPFKNSGSLCTICPAELGPVEEFCLYTSRYTGINIHAYRNPSDSILNRPLLSFDIGCKNLDREPPVFIRIYKNIRPIMNSKGFIKSNNGWSIPVIIDEIKTQTQIESTVQSSRKPEDISSNLNLEENLQFISNWREQNAIHFSDQLKFTVPENWTDQQRAMDILLSFNLKELVDISVLLLVTQIIIYNYRLYLNILKSFNEANSNYAWTSSINQHYLGTVESYSTINCQ